MKGKEALETTKKLIGEMIMEINSIRAKEFPNLELENLIEWYGNDVYFRDVNDQKRTFVGVDVYDVYSFVRGYYNCMKTFQFKFESGKN